MLKIYCTKTFQYYLNFSGVNADIKTSALERNLKEYETLQLEAARMERDAQRVFMENALLEQVSNYSLATFVHEKV